MMFTASDIVQSTLDPSGQIAVHIPDILQPLLPALKWTTVRSIVKKYVKMDDLGFNKRSATSIDLRTVESCVRSC